jgi:hypothetical protein
MEVDEVVDAELAGLDLGEARHYPSLPDAQLKFRDHASAAAA